MRVRVDHVPSKRPVRVVVTLDPTRGGRVVCAQDRGVLVQWDDGQRGWALLAMVREVTP